MLNGPSIRTVETTPTIVRHGPGCRPLACHRPEAAAERALAAEMLARERRVDDRDRLAVVEIVVGERAAFEQLLPGDREEAAGHLLEVRVRPIAVLAVGLAVDLDRAVAGEHHAEAVGQRHGFELRRPRSKRLQQPLVERLARGRRRIVAVHQPHPRRHHAVGVVAVVDRLLVDDRSHLQQRADQQHAGDDDLEHDQAARDEADTLRLVLPRPPSRKTSTAFARDDIQRRQQAREHGRRKRGERR